MSVYKNRDDRWIVDVKLRMPGERLPTRVRRVSPVHTRRGAERYEREVRAALMDGSWGAASKPAPMPTPPPKPKRRPTAKRAPKAPGLEVWGRIFIAEHSEAKGLKPSTCAEQATAFRVHLVPLLGASTPIDTIRTPHFDQLRCALASKGLAPSTINNNTSVLSRAVRFFYERQGLPVPHFDTCRVKVPKSPPKFWEPDQYAALVRAAEALGATELAMVLLMGDCGLRTGEVIALEWSHVRWQPEPQIVVQRSHWKGHFGAPKGNRPRTVPMSSRLAAALGSLPRSISPAHPWVLVRESKHGRGHHTQCSLGWAMGHVERAARLGREGKRGELHRLRHGFVTRLAAAGVPPRAIMELAGHTRIETTMRYMHLIAGAGSRAMAALESFDQLAAGELGQDRGSETEPEAGFSATGV